MLCREPPSHGVPHMLYEQLQWIKKCPPSQPRCTLSVTVSVKGYQENGHTPPPATRRRNTDISALADTGTVVCCMRLTHLHALGLTGKDLLQPILNLSAANASGINIMGVTFLMFTGWAGDGGRTRCATCQSLLSNYSFHAELASGWG